MNSWRIRYYAAKLNLKQTKWRKCYTLSHKIIGYYKITALTARYKILGADDHKAHDDECENKPLII